MPASGEVALPPLASECAMKVVAATVRSTGRGVALLRRIDSVTLP